MHDIKLIRESPDIFDKALEKRGESSEISKIIALDTQRRKIIEKLEKLLAERKKLSKKVFYKLLEKEKKKTKIT